MKTLHFKAKIDCSRTTVWNMMLAKETYGNWAMMFRSGARYEGSWEKDSPMRFVDKKGNGLSAVIAENRPYEFLSIKYLGIVKNCADDTEDEAVRSSFPAFENLTYTTEDRSTILCVDAEVQDEHADHMQIIWEMALAQLTALCEDIWSPP